jgi:hypothetical protein
LATTWDSPARAVVALSGVMGRSCADAGEIPARASATTHPNSFIQNPGVCGGEDIGEANRRPV